MVARGAARLLPLPACLKGVYARLRRAMERVGVRGPLRKLKFATQSLTGHVTCDCPGPRVRVRVGRGRPPEQVRRRRRRGSPSRICCRNGVNNAYAPWPTGPCRSLASNSNAMRRSGGETRHCRSRAWPGGLCARSFQFGLPRRRWLRKQSP